MKKIKIEPLCARLHASGSDVIHKMFLKLQKQNSVAAFLAV